MEKVKECGCPHCETELKKGCVKPEFCKPCGVMNKKIKVCRTCKAEFLAEYDQCPSCVSAARNKGEVK